MFPLNRISVPGFWIEKRVYIQWGVGARGWGRERRERETEREKNNKKTSKITGLLTLTISNSSAGMQSWWSTWSTRVMDFDPASLRSPSLSHDMAPADELDISDAMPPSTGAKGLCVYVCMQAMNVSHVCLLHSGEFSRSLIFAENRLSVKIKPAKQARLHNA